MEEMTLEEKLCRGAKPSEDDEGFRKIEKVLAPFMRTLKKKKHEKADFLPAEQEELYLKKNTKEIISRLVIGLKDPLELRTAMNETGELLKVVTKSKSFNLYLTNYERMEILLCPKLHPNNTRFEKRYAIESGTYVAAHVAFTKDYIISRDILGDVRFPLGIPDVAAVKSVICLPILTNVELDCIGIIELYRECSDRPYDLVNLQICNALTTWMGIAVEQYESSASMKREINIQKQLSHLIDMYFSGVVPFNKVVSDILKVAKATAKAEKGAFYLFHEPVPHQTEEILWADAYEEGVDEQNFTALYKKRDKIKFVKGKPGIPGYAARTGELINIVDAYKDHRFDRKTDPGFFRTRAVIAFPIKNENGVLAVLKLLNCRDYPYFRAEEIASVESLLSYYTSICSFHLLETAYIKTQLRLKIVDGLLDFHTKPSAEDLITLKGMCQAEQNLPPGFLRFDWETSNYEDDVLKCIAVAFLHSDVLEPCFDLQNLSDFLLRVKRIYRAVVYHNLDHAFSVFHFAYNIILRNKDFFTNVEVTAILLAALCHDVDHPGFTNGFMILKNDVVYKLYGDVCGEAHRYEFVLGLIQESDLLSNFSEQNYQFICKTLKKLIVGFDLSLHFQNRQKLVQLYNSRSLDWQNPDHRNLAHNMVLFCSDHSINFKSFETVKKSVSLLYKELHRQGDLEKSMGFSPLPMLDRNKSDLIPENHIIYLSIVMLPCVEILYAIFPNLKVLEETLRDTINKWKEWTDMRGQDMWKISQALYKDRKEKKPSHRVTLVSTLSSVRTLASETRSDKFLI